MPLSVRQAANLANRSVPSIKNWCRSGQLRSTKIKTPWGSFSYAIRRSDLLKFMKTRQDETRGRPRGSKNKKPL